MISQNNVSEYGEQKKTEMGTMRGNNHKNTAHRETLTNTHRGMHKHINTPREAQTYTQTHKKHNHRHGNLKKQPNTDTQKAHIQIYKEPYIHVYIHGNAHTKL